MLASARLDHAENTAPFLGHLPGRRGARGIRANLRPGALLLDEASMMPTADMPDIADYATANGHKVVVAGDQQQLPAVEGGGAMALLADQLGYVQLAEAVRFTSEWERGASLGLRQGEKQALEDYDRHGRITGDEPDLALDLARSAYLGSYLSSRGVLMIAHTHETCQELSRRVRDDLVHLGLVDDRRTTEIRDGAKAGLGDLIVARRDHRQRDAAVAVLRDDQRRRAEPGPVPPTMFYQVSTPTRPSAITRRRRPADHFSRPKRSPSSARHCSAGFHTA